MLWTSPAFHFLFFSFPECYNCPPQENQSETEKLFHSFTLTVEGLRGRRGESRRQALWKRYWRLHGHRFPLCHLGMIGDWFLNAIVSSINGYWVIWEIRHWKCPCVSTLILSAPVRLCTVSHAEFDMPETLRQRSLGQSHIHEQRSHRTPLALWDWIRPFPMELNYAAGWAQTIP